jgi:O-antigen ligase
MAGEGVVASSCRMTSAASYYLDATIRCALFVFIASLPFNGLLVIERNGFLILLGLLVLWCGLNRKLFYVRTPYDAMLLAFVLWVGMTIPFSVFPEYSLKEYGKLLQWMIVFYAVIYFVGARPYRLALMSLLGLTALVVSVRGLTQLNLTDPQAVIGYFSSEVWLTTFLIMIIPFGLSAACSEGPTVIRIIGTVLALFAAACLFGTQSRAGLVALVGELWVMAWLVRTWYTKMIAGIATLSVIAVAATLFFSAAEPAIGQGNDMANALPVKKGFSSVVHRLDIWAFTLSKIWEHWLVGIGYGSHSYLMLYGRDQEVVAPGHFPVMQAGTHNILLYLSLHVGLVGMVLFVWFYFSAIRITFQEYQKTKSWMSKMVLAGMTGSMIGLFLRLQFDQMFVGSLAVLFWVFLALSIMHYPSFTNQIAEPVSA